MPFKTKARKLAARERHYTFAKTQIYSFLGQNQLQDAGKLKFAQENKKDSFVKEGIGDLNYVKGELVKIFLAASLIIIAQIVLALTPKEVWPTLFP